MPGYDDYEVSDDGRIRSLKFGKVKEIALKRNKKQTSYWNASLYKAGKVKTKAIHLLVAEAFRGPRPSLDHEACHDDGDIENNSLTNILWKTRLENAADQARHGTIAIGERHGRSKLTMAQASEIKLLIKEGIVPLIEIGRRFGVGDCAIHRIKNDKTWRAA